MLLPASSCLKVLKSLEIKIPSPKVEKPIPLLFTEIEVI